MRPHWWVLVWHVPVLLQVCPDGQVPQLPPQPSSPHCLPLQLGVQEDTHWLSALQV
jgi:hypothetical protein